MYTSLLTQFCHRRRMVRLINRYRCLARKRPLVMRLWQRGIQHKCLSIAFTELMHIIIVILLVWRLKFSLVLCLVFVYLPVTFLDMVTFQFYFALLNAQVYNRLLNQELRSLFAEMMMLELLANRRDALTIKCGSISDRLDAIAFEKGQLQQLIEDLIGMFGLQSLCVSAHYYVTLITLIFYTYNVIKLNRYNLVVGLFLAKFISHILGMYITSNVAFQVLDEHRETVSLLATFSTSGLRLDERLEAAVSLYPDYRVSILFSSFSQCESFVLQLASNPLRLPVLRAFNIDQRNIIIMLSSVITYSLVIIEFDIENFRAL